MSTYAELAKRAGCSQRQTDVLDLVDQGYSLAQAARILGISKESVRTHRDRGYDQLRRYLQEKHDEPAA